MVVAANVQARGRGETNVMIRTETTKMELPRAAAMAAAHDASLAEMANAASGALLRNELGHNELDMGSNQSVLTDVNEFNAIGIAVICIIVMICICICIRIRICIRICIRIIVTTGSIRIGMVRILIGIIL